MSQISTAYGRLVYLTSLRNGDTGRYEHHGLAMVYGGDAAHRALLESHESCFRQWLGYPLQQQKSDLEEYLAGLPFEQTTLLDTWQQLAPYRNLCPVSARAAERDLFCSDLEAVLELIRCGSVGRTDPSA